MQAFNFPGCCGARILAGFGHTDTAFDRGFHLNPLTKSQVQAWVESQLRWPQGFHTIILNQDQVPIVGPWIKEMGFRCVGKAYYSGHASTLSLYVHAKKKPKRGEQKKARRSR